MQQPKRYLVAGLVFLTLSTVGVVTLVTRTATGAASTDCSTQGQLYRVVIQNDQVSPQNTDARRCDKLEFTNLDNTVREIAFGPHEHHVAYDGVAERLLGRNQSFTITLNQVGLYHFHDHIHDEVSGFFNVIK